LTVRDDFEDGDVTDWTNGGVTTWVASQDQSHGGDWSGKGIHTTPGKTVYKTPEFPIQNTYEFVVWMYYPTSGLGRYFGLYINDSSGSTICQLASGDATEGITGWPPGGTSGTVCVHKVAEWVKLRIVYHYDTAKVDYYVYAANLDLYGSLLNQDISNNSRPGRYALGIRAGTAYFDDCEWEVATFGPPTIVSPDGGSSETSPVYLVFTTVAVPDTGVKRHFLLQVDKTSDAFGDLEIDLDSRISQTNWEYWDGDSWEVLPAAGLDPAYYGNNVRYQATLTDGDKWWKVQEQLRRDS